MEQLIFSSVVNGFVAMPSSIETLPNAHVQGGRRDSCFASV